MEDVKAAIGKDQRARHVRQLGGDVFGGDDFLFEIGRGVMSWHNGWMGKRKMLIVPLLFRGGNYYLFY